MIIQSLFAWKHFATTVVIFVLLYLILNFLFKHRKKGVQSKRLLKQLTMGVLAIIGLIAIILSIPMSDVMRSNVTSLLGIVISAVLALSSTTFIGNAFAGVFHKMVGTFKPGDMIQTVDYFGKVTEQGLFHTEIQDVNSNLITIPNLYLVNHPVEVFRSTGTIVTAEVSLGYEVHHQTIESRLLEAALKTGLEAPFVYVKELGDFSVVYQVNGKLLDVGKLLLTQSNLKSAILDLLHKSQIEIVSPHFMNQRQVNEQVFIPTSPTDEKQLPIKEEIQPDAIVFDKADKAESIEKKKEVKAELDQKILELEKQWKEAKEKVKKELLYTRLQHLKDGRDKLIAKIDKVIEDFESET